MDTVREGVEGSRGGSRGEGGSKLHRQKVCLGMQGSGRSGTDESRLEDLFRRQLGGEMEGATSVCATCCIRQLGKIGGKVRGSDSCSEVGLHPWADAHMHSASTYSGRSLAISLPSTSNRLSNRSEHDGGFVVLDEEDINYL